MFNTFKSFKTIRALMTLRLQTFINNTFRTFTNFVTWQSSGKLVSLKKIYPGISINIYYILFYFLKKSFQVDPKEKK